MMGNRRSGVPVEIWGRSPVWLRTDWTVLASLADGDSTEEILKDFPTLTAIDVRAVIAFAAASAEEDLPLQALPRAS
jgi:hypothetical protein